MGFFKKAFGLFTQSTVSKIIGVLVLLILVSTVAFTIVTLQKQQTIKQQASDYCTGTCYDLTACPDWDPIPMSGTCPSEPVQGICCGNTNTPTPTPPPAYTCETNGGGCYDLTTCPSWDPQPVNGTCPTEPYPAICCGPAPITPTPTPYYTLCRQSGGDCIGDTTAPLYNCPANYELLNISCGIEGSICCKYSPSTPTPTPTARPTTTPTATPTARPTTTPSPNNSITLSLGLNVQDAPTPNDIPIEYRIITAQNFSELRGEHRFLKSDNSQRRYSDKLGPFNLVENANYIINFFRTDNKMIGKTTFTASKGTVTVATVILVFGDLNNDKNVNLLDYSIFRGCWGQPITGTCSTSDFDENGTINEVDYNTWLRGFVTWSKEGL